MRFAVFVDSAMCGCGFLIAWIFLTPACGLDPQVAARIADEDDYQSEEGFT